MESDRGESLVSIPGWAYVLVGGIVAGVSKYLTSKPDASAGLKLFFWLGLLLVAVGIFKIVFGYIMGEKKSVVDEEGEGQKMRSPKDRPAHARDAIYCSRCKAKLHPQSRYCNWCGTRVT